MDAQFRGLLKINSKKADDFFKKLPYHWSYEVGWYIRKSIQIPNSKPYLSNYKP